LVEEIARADGWKHATMLLRSVGEQVAASVAVPSDTNGRVAAAAEALRSLGGDLEIEETKQGWRLQGYGCPLSAVTAKSPQVCELATALVEEITGQPVTECCEHGERPRCCFRISRTRQSRT
jgi:predicted ArsR family transcriptional regulator